MVTNKNKKTIDKTKPPQYNIHMTAGMFCYSAPIKKTIGERPLPKSIAVVILSPTIFLEASYE